MGDLQEILCPMCGGDKIVKEVFLGVTLYDDCPECKGDGVLLREVKEKPDAERK